MPTVSLTDLADMCYCSDKWQLTLVHIFIYFFLRNRSRSNCETEFIVLPQY